MPGQKSRPEQEQQHRGGFGYGTALLERDGWQRSVQLGTVDRLPPGIARQPPAQVEDARLGELELVGSEHLEPMPLVRSPLAVVAAVGELPAIEDDEPSVTVIVPLTAKVPLAAGGGKLRKGRTRA